MEIVIIMLLFVLGLILGIFINLILYKIRNDGVKYYDFLRCKNCKKNQKLLFLVPIINNLIYKGRCSECGEKISWYNSGVGFATGLIFSVSYTFMKPQDLNNWILLFGNLTFVLFLIAIFIYDFKHYLIPDIITVPGIILALLFSIVNYKISLWQAIVGAIISGAFFLFFVLISKERWMGWGDVKLGLFIGALMGWPMVIAGLLVSFIAGGVVGLILIILKRKSMKSEVPLGVFLTLGTFIALLWGDYIINKYLNIIV